MQSVERLRESHDKLMATSQLLEVLQQDMYDALRPIFEVRREVLRQQMLLRQQSMLPEPRRSDFLITPIVLLSLVFMLVFSLKKLRSFLKRKPTN